MLLRLTLMLAAVWLAMAPAQAQTLFRPVAVVNDSAITGYDLAQRAQILVALGFGSASPDALRAEALDQLVEDRLKLQAGQRIGLAPTAELVEAGIEQYANNLNLGAAEFRTLMSNRGVTAMALEDMIGAEMVWLQVVRARFSGRVEPGEAEIEAELALIAQRNAFEYRILEIGLPLNEPNRSEAQTRALAEQLFVELNAGGDFSEAVRRYSRAPSAARGGEIGWVSSERMPADLLRALSELQPGQVSRPLSVAGGLSLIKLLDRRAASAASPTLDPSARDAIRDRLITQRSARLAEGLLQEMRRDALIEIR